MVSSKRSGAFLPEKLNKRYKYHTFFQGILESLQTNLFKELRKNFRRHRSILVSFISIKSENVEMKINLQKKPLPIAKRRQI